MSLAMFQHILKSVCSLCVEVHDTVVKAITKVTEKLNYSPGTPKVAFLCSTVSKIGDELLCTRVRNTKGGPLTDGHRIWLRGEV